MGSKAAHTTSGCLREGPRRTRGDTAPKSTAGHAEPTPPGQRQGRGPRGAAGAWPAGREGKGEARPLHPLSGSGRGPGGRSPEVPAWSRGWQRGWTATGGPARAAGADAQPAALPQHQQTPQQHRQRTRLSGGRGLHCSPRRRQRAALRSRPRAAWSHAPPAPRALGPAPRPRLASGVDRRALLRGAGSPEFPFAPSRKDRRRTAPFPGDRGGGCLKTGARHREGRGIGQCPPYHRRDVLAEPVASEVTVVSSQGGSRGARTGDRKSPPHGMQVWPLVPG